MEIIVVTFYKGLNYGSMLQAAALRMALEKQGHSVRFLSRFMVPTFLAIHPRLLASRVHKKATLRRRRKFFVPTDYLPSDKKQARLSEYGTTETPETAITSRQQWRKVIDDQTVFIAGSDIIWNPANEMPGKYFLDFAVTAKLACFAYAASIGASSLPKKYGWAYRRYLGHYLAVGVRESSSIPLISEYYKGRVEQVVDPTLLLTAKEWDEFAGKARLSIEVNKEGYILCYFVMDDQWYWEYVREAQSVLGLQVIVLPMHDADGKSDSWDRVEDATPYEFVWLIKHAAAVITDSFHACSFCLTYERELYLLRRSRKAEDSKYDDFLGRYQLENRSIEGGSSFARVSPSFTDAARQALVEDREQSTTFLRQTLSEVSVQHQSTRGIG